MRIHCTPGLQHECWNHLVLPPACHPQQATFQIPLASLEQCWVEQQQAHAASWYPCVSWGYGREQQPEKKILVKKKWLFQTFKESTKCVSKKKVILPSVNKNDWIYICKVTCDIKEISGSGYTHDIHKKKT